MIWCVCVSAAGAAETVYPVADGTLVDGGVYGPFDGAPDVWDWTFDQTGYEGAITLATGSPTSSREQRVTWEYDLSGVTLATPVAATVTFTIRGAAIFPFPDVEVHVYAYSADLLETPGDFSAEPAVFVGSVTVVPYQEPTLYTLDATDVVNQALVSGDNKVALRFQIDPNTAHTANQAFIDALDSDPASKPFLTIREAGDLDDDGDVDLADYTLLAGCLSGPNVTTPPGGCTPGQFDSADLDGDNDVDLGDFAAFSAVFPGS